MERAIFAGGCFWCMVQPFEEQAGILSVRSGYTGGHLPNPSYEQVCAKTTGHTEAVEIIFDPKQIAYKDLVELYWTQTDPTDAFGQFEDRGDNTVLSFTTQRKDKKKLQSNQKQTCKLQDVLTNPLSPLLNQQSHFISQRIITKDFIKRIPSGMHKAVLFVISF